MKKQKLELCITCPTNSNSWAQSTETIWPDGLVDTVSDWALTGWAVFGDICSVCMYISVSCLIAQWTAVPYIRLRCVVNQFNHSCSKTLRFSEYHGHSALRCKFIVSWDLFRVDGNLEQKWLNKLHILYSYLADTLFIISSSHSGYDCVPVWRNSWILPKYNC